MSIRGQCLTFIIPGKPRVTQQIDTSDSRIVYRILSLLGQIGSRLYLIRKTFHVTPSGGPLLDVKHTLDIHTAFLAISNIGTLILGTDIGVTIHIDIGVSSRLVKAQPDDFFPGKRERVDTLIENNGRRSFINRRKDYSCLTGDIRQVPKPDDIITGSRDITVLVGIGFAQINIVRSYTYHLTPIVAVGYIVRCTFFNVKFLG